MTSVKTMPRKAKETKKEGCIPAVYYGSHAKSTPIFVDAREFSQVLAHDGSSSSVTLVTEHGNEIAMIQDVQLHPVKNHPVHVDFLVLEKGQKVHVKIPILFTGESPAVKAGGVLVKVIHDLSVEGEPSKLPHDFSVDLSVLVEASSVIHVRDIILPSGVELYHLSPEEVIASIATQAEEQTEAPVAVDLSAIEVEKKGKKEEEAATE